MWTNGHPGLDDDLAPCGTAIFSDEGRLLAVNETLIHMLALDRDTLAGKAIDDLLAPPARVFLQMVLLPMLRLKQRANEVTLILRSTSGADIHVLCNGVRRVAAQGAVNHCVFLQVEQRRKVEEQLMQSWRAASEVPGAIFQLEMDASGASRFLHIGDSIVRMTGIPAVELRRDAEAFFETVIPQDRARMLAAMRDSSRQGQSGRYEFRLVPAGATKVSWCEVHVTPRKLPGGAVLWNGYVSDITQQRAIEEQLRDTDRLRLTAMLASGIAHDFNNVLGSISGLAEISLLGADEGSRLQRNLNNILVSARRASGLVRQMLEYSRQTPTTLQHFSLTDLLRQCEPLLKVGLPSNVSLKVEATCVAAISADRVQIEQVLLNLVNNAGYAMRECGGTITMRLEEAEASEANPIKGAAVCLRVIDAGCGIAPKDVGNVFQPFFTTKPVGEGTGLGLAAAHGIVKGHGGHIEVQSQLGAGSTFSVWLPRIAEIAA